MANRLVSNMYIIDSQQIAIPLAYGNTFGTVASGSAGKMVVKGVVFMPTDTTGTLTIALGNTTNVVLKYVAWGSGTIIQSGYPQVDHWDEVTWNQVFIPTLTACTATLILG